ncbi:MAG: tail fiber protein [Syntrophomonas sp.]
MDVDAYIGEIRMFGGIFAPVGWAFCDGRLLPIAGNDLLFSLIGTTYGGDGVSNFALPDLRGRIPISQGQGPGLSDRTVGQMDGAETVTLLLEQIPAHTHTAAISTALGISESPANAFWAASNFNQYSSSPPNGAMSPAALTVTGGNQPHDNMMPFLTVNYIIALDGYYPTHD